MPLEIIRNDITNMQVDAIVNAANHLPVIGYGVDSGIHKKAGNQLIEARKVIGEIAFGDAAITPGFNLDSKYVIHTATPIWLGGDKEEIRLLESCYKKSLQLALEYKCKSIAFPLLSAGNYQFPKDIAIQTAIDVFNKFLMKHEMQIYLVVFEKSALCISEKLFKSIQSFIDENYIQEKALEEYDIKSGEYEGTIDQLHKTKGAYKRNCTSKSTREKFIYNAQFDEIPFENLSIDEDLSLNSNLKLEDFLKITDETFSECLLRLIDQKGLTEPVVYKKANIDRKLFSKIINNKNYKPRKVTCIAFAIALELDIDETRDFIGKAGYALTHSSKFDLIIEFFIRMKNYDIFAINNALFYYDMPPIGC